ncbi:Eukaryotic initiation factor 4A-II, partial [Mortierella sp. AM989]
ALYSKSTQFVYFSETPVVTATGEASEYLKNSIEVSFKKGELEFEGIKQYYVLVDKQDDKKFEALCAILRSMSSLPAVVYCNTHPDTEQLAEKLKAQKFPTLKVYRNMEPSLRKGALDKFQKGPSSVLVATDALWHGDDLENRFAPV